MFARYRVDGSLHASCAIIHKRLQSENIFFPAKYGWKNPRVFKQLGSSSRFASSPSGSKEFQLSLLDNGNQHDVQETWITHPDLQEHIRSSDMSIVSKIPQFLEDGTRNPEYQKAVRDSQFSVSCLGTGAGTPSLKRCNPAAILRADSSTYLFDAGEAVQTQILRSRYKLGDIQKVLISHMHGDHLFGLPGLLLNMENAHRESSLKTIKLYGPPGLYNYVTASISLAGTTFSSIKVIVHELHGGSRRSSHIRYLREFPEFKLPGVSRQIIEQNPTDHTWTIEEAEEITSPDVAGLYYSTPSGFHIKAAELDHTRKVQCFGYCVEEPKTQPRSLDVKQALELGVEDCKKYALLKSGFSVMSDSLIPPREIHPDEVCIGGPKLPRKFVYLGDCRSPVPKPMVELSYNADVIIHEATFSKNDTSSKSRVGFGGHSSAQQAGLFANHVKAKVLILNHISQGYNNKTAQAALVQEAAEEIRNNTTRVQLGYDFLEIQVPRSGFDLGDLDRN